MIKRNLTCKIFSLAVVLSFSVLSGIAADRYSVATGNWNATSTWSATSGGASGASVPVAGDNVIIEGGYTVTVNAASACNNITIANGSILVVGGFNFTVNGTAVVNGTFSHTSTTGTKTYIGLVTVDASGIWNNNTINESITIRGGITNNGTFNAGTGIYTFNTNNQALTGTLLIPRVTVTGITLTNNGTLTVGTALSGMGGLTQGVNATLNLGGTSGITTLTASNGGNTVNFAGAAQTVKAISYYNLTISGSGNKTMSGNVSADGTLTLTSGALSIAANSLTLSDGANLSYGAGSLTGGVTSNLTIGTGADITLNAIANELNDFTTSRNITLGANLSLNGTLTLTAGSFTVGANTLTLNGPTIAGTPSNLSTSASSSLVFGGTSAGVLIPSSAANLNNLTVNNSNGVTLTGNVTVSNTLTMTQGNITTGAFTLALSNGVAGSLTRVSGTVIGRLRRTINTTLSTDYIFPVGTAAFYRPAIMNFSSLSAGTDITAEFIATPPAGFIAYTDGVANLDNTFTEGYWRFFSSGLPAATYTLTLTGNGFISYTINEGTRITGRDNGNTTWRALGAHGTQSGNDVSRTGVTNLNTTSFDFALAHGCIMTLMGYTYERNITIDFTKVTGGSNLYNFPVLVNITGQNFLKSSPAGQIFNANGFDIIFTDGNYNKLDHQLEYYNGTNGDLIAWVRIPTLSSSSNTVIKILYGNPLISTDPSVTSVWDSHYKGVWHLDNSNLNDFTSYNKSGTPYNTPTYPAGRIYNSLGLNGTNQYVEVINDPNINFAGNITVSAWVNMGVGGRDQKIAGNQNNSSGGYKFGIYTNNKVEFEIRNAANTPSLNRDEPGGTVLSTGQWYYLAGISSDVLDSIKTFVNGNPERPFKKTGILGTASNNLTIGKEPFQSSYYFNGRFDEIRISDKVRSNGWMRTEYNNQSSPSTFYALDAVEVLSNKLPSAGFCTGPITLTFGYPSGGTYSGNPYIVGNVFTPPSAGTYPIIYTYNGVCGLTGVTKDFIITDAPPAPVAPNKEYCSNQIAYLEATSGENIRWYSGGTLVSTANPYSTGQTAAGTYNYTVTQTVNGCESPATAVSLTLFSGITINTQPQPSAICDGDNAAFTVAASGYNLTYRWQENGVNISNGGIYSGATTASLSLTNPGIAKNGMLYRCVISSSCGASPLNSNTALLTVTTLPVATFSYTGTPYCINAANPSPTFSGGGVAGTFSSTPGLVFVSTATGEVDLASSTAGTYIVTNTIAAAGGCGVVTATSPITIISDLIWTGAVSTDWNDPGNWSCGFIPNSTTLVQIPNVANKPVLSSGSIGTVNNLVIDNGSSLTVDGNTIQISGTITNNGTFTASAGIVEMNGSVAQLIGSNVFAGNTIMDLIINNPAGVTLQGPLNITGIFTAQNGDFTSGGYLTLISTAAQTALIDGSGAGTITGDVTMQRYLPSGFGYKYFSSPFQAAIVNEFGDDMNLASPFTSFYRYDENRTVSGWVGYSYPDSLLKPVQGYAVNFGSVAAPNTVDVKGTVNNGILSVTLYNHDRIYTKGFNLVGNPYPSPIDWDAGSGWTRTDIDNALYYFKASTSDEYGGTYRTYINGVSSDDTVSNIIPSMQGFFIHVANGTWPVTGTLAMNNSVRITDMTHSFTKSKSNNSVPLLRLVAGFSDDPASADPVVIYFDEKASDGFDSNLDALKLMNTDLMVTNLYTVGSDGAKLSISALPPVTDNLCKVPLGLKLNKAGNVIFKIRDVDESFTGMRIYLSDVLTDTEQDLLPDKEYSLYLNTGEYPDRFFLNLSNITTDIDDKTQNNDLFSVYSTHGILKAEINSKPGENGIFFINNLTGQVLFTEKIYQPGYHEFNTGLKDGVYIVTYICGTKRSSKKIIILNP